MILAGRGVIRLAVYALEIGVKREAEGACDPAGVTEHLMLRPGGALRASSISLHSFAFDHACPR